MATEKKEKREGSQKRELSPYTFDSSDAEDELLRTYGKATDEFNKNDKAARAWVCKTCHRADVSRDVRKSQEECVLCVEIGLLRNLPTKKLMCGELRKRMELHIDMLSKS
eukprot:8689547-Alexandrium_andersonii.AAC.1